MSLLLDKFACIYLTSREMTIFIFDAPRGSSNFVDED